MAQLGLVLYSSHLQKAGEQKDTSQTPPAAGNPEKKTEKENQREKDQHRRMAKLETSTFNLM